MPIALGAWVGHGKSKGRDETVLKPLLTRLAALIRGNSLPCLVLCRKPLILTSYWEDFFRSRELILHTFRPESRPVFLFQFGWHRETPERIAELVREVRACAVDAGRVRFVFLCNSEVETSLVQNAGLEGLYCHQNAFLDERRYPLRARPKRFDAIYIARITPFKRHPLASQIPHLKLIGGFHAREKAYVNQTMRLLEHARWKHGVPSSRISWECAEAATGLCLSAEEGGMFVSAEYLLSGIPIVTTVNLGGRAGLFDERYTRTVVDTPEAVREAVEELAGMRCRPEDIRQAVIAKMEVHRDILRQLLGSLYAAEGCKWDGISTWQKLFVHKLGIRCSVGLRDQFTRVLKPHWRL